MARITPFPVKTIPHLRGLARCLHCAHTWEAVTPEGIILGLECTACGLYKGVLQGLTEPEYGRRWVCHCGSDLFYLLPHGCQCLLCGVIAKGF